MVHARQLDRMVEAIYDAVLEPQGWTVVGELLKGAFRSDVEAFYRVGYERGGFEPLYLAGIDDAYVRSFPEHFFRADNPFLRAAPLHRVGVVRTDETVQRFVADARMLRRSAYYNEWLRPQGLDHTLGTTLDEDGATVTNLTLLRPAGVGAFTPRETAAFARVARHLRRAVRIAARVDRLAAREAADREALDALAHGVMFVGMDGRPRYCNRVADATLRAGDRLTVKHGRLCAAAAGDRAGFETLIAALAAGAAPGSVPAAMSLSGRTGVLHVVALRLSAAPLGIAAGEPCVLVLLVDSRTGAPAPAERWRTRYGLTAMEAAVTDGVVAGRSLRQVAEALSISYETARWYLKIVFHKTGVARQAELVSRLLSDAPTAGP